MDTKASSPLSLGEAKLRGEQILINVTPSPGATTGIYNGLTDAKTIAVAIGCSFDNQQVESDFTLSLS